MLEDEIVHNPHVDAVAAQPTAFLGVSSAAAAPSQAAGAIASSVSALAAAHQLALVAHVQPRWHWTSALAADESHC